MASRFDRISAGNWRWMSPALRFLSEDLAAVEDTVAAGSGGGTVVVRDPAPDGTWPRRDRPKGVVWLWRRALTDTENAPVPTEEDGYAPGDMIEPPPEPEPAGPYVGVLFSDSMIGSGVTPVDGRVADNYAGGDGQMWVWGVASGQHGGGKDVRAGLGLDLGDTGAATIKTPPFPLDRDYRVSWDVNAPDNNDYGGLVLRGNSVASRIVILQVRGSAEGTTVRVATWEPENWAPAVTLGTVAAPVGARLTCTVRGNDLVVEYGGQVWTHTLTGEAASLPRQFGFYAGIWGQFHATNIMVEVL